MKTPPMTTDAMEAYIQRIGTLLAYPSATPWPALLLTKYQVACARVAEHRAAGNEQWTAATGGVERAFEALRAELEVLPN